MSLYSAPVPFWKSPPFRRTIVYSAVAHIVGTGLFAWAPSSQSSSLPPQPVLVEVVAAVPAPPSSTERQVVEEAVVIPDVPRRKPRRPKPPEKKPPKKKPAPPDVSDLMAQLRKGVEAKQPQPTTKPQGAPGRVDPELAAYFKTVKSCLDANWVGARQFLRRRDLLVRFEVTIALGGALRNVSRVSGSGVREFDETAERAITKCAPFPEPPRGSVVLPLTFIPGGVQ